MFLKVASGSRNTQIADAEIEAWFSNRIVK
jgi:hypothetical protein